MRLYVSWALLYLTATFEKELVRVDTVADRVANEWEPVKHDRRFIWIFEQQLSQYIDHDAQDNDRGEAQSSEHVD